MRDRRSKLKTAMALAGATLLSAYAVEGRAGVADAAQGVIVPRAPHAALCRASGR